MSGKINWVSVTVALIMIGLAFSIDDMAWRCILILLSIAEFGLLGKEKK